MNSGFYSNIQQANPLPISCVKWFWDGFNDSGVIGGPTTFLANHPFATYGLVSRTTIGAWVEYRFLIRAGIYKFDFSYLKIYVGGIFDFYLDGVPIYKGLDSYFGSTTPAQLLTVNNISLSAGEHVLRIQSDAKNASSSGYGIRFTLFSFVPMSVQ